MAEDDRKAELPRWKPKLHGKNSRSKRRVSAADPLANLGNYPRATMADLDDLIANLGKNFDVDAEKRKLLLAGINDLAFNAADVLRRTAALPSESEMKERMRSIEVAAISLLAALEVEHSPAELYQRGALSLEINPNLVRRLAHAANQDRPDRTLIADAVTAVAALAVFAGKARKAKQPQRLQVSPEAYLSQMLAALYREIFGREPARTNGGPWLKFLGWGLSKGLNHNLSDDRLRRLPIRPSR